MRNFLLFIWLLLSVALSAQTVSQVRNQSTNPTYIPDGTTAKPPLCFNRSNHSFFGYAGGQWYQLSPAAAYVDPDPDPLNEKIVSVTVDPITNVLRINEAGTFFNVPINSIVAEASISGSGTITVTNVGGVVTISSTDPDENATNECNMTFDVTGGNLRIGDACGTLQLAVTDIAPIQNADNGLSLQGSTVILGGTLNQPTNIALDGNALIVQGDSTLFAIDEPNNAIVAQVITPNGGLLQNELLGGNKSTSIRASLGSNEATARVSETGVLLLKGSTEVQVITPNVSAGLAASNTYLRLLDPLTGRCEWDSIPPPDLCEQIQSLPIGTPNGSEKVVYWGSSPSGFVGFDFDNAADFSCSGGDPTTTYLYDFQFSGGSTTLVSPLLLTDVVGIQGVINGNLIPDLNAALGLSLVAGDILWQYNSSDNTITVWYNPSIILYPNNFVIGDIIGACKENHPLLPTTHGGGCFLGDAPSGGLASARNGLTAVGDTVELGGTLIKPTMVIGNAISSLTIGSVDMPNYVHIGEFSDRVKQFSFDNTGTSEFQLQGGNSFLQSFNTARLQGDIGVYLTTSSTGKLFIQPPNYSSKSVGDILTLLDPLTGEADYTDGNATFWRTDGNIGTDGGTNNFIGTTDAVGLAFRTDNQERMRLQDSGELSLGTTSWLPNCPVNIKGNNTKNIVHFSTDNVLAGYIVEHTPSGNFAGIAATAGNAGALVNATGQFPFTVATGTSTNFTTTTVGTYNSTGFGIGGGFAPTSTLQLQGSYATNALVIAANYTATGTDHTLLCNNGATAITVTLPNPTTCLGREYRVLRYAGSTGTITVTDARGAAASVQDLAGTLGVTTTIAALGSHDDWSVLFKSVTVGATSSWIRID